MPNLNLTEYEASILAFVMRRGVKKLTKDIESLEARFGDSVMPEIIAEKKNKIGILRKAAKQIRYDLDA